MLPPMRRRHTINSNHNYRKYKNLVKEFVPTAPNQLWVADITYVDTDEGVCYLHLITDAFTHEIIGWVVSDTLLAINTQEALEQAICQADAESLLHLIHHSDRGSQYCCNAYVNRLKEIGAHTKSHEREALFGGFTPPAVRQTTVVFFMVLFGRINKKY